MTKFQWAVIGILTVAVIGVISVLALLVVVSMPTLIAPSRTNSFVIATVTPNPTATPEPTTIRVPTLFPTRTAIPLPTSTPLLSNIDLRDLAKNPEKFTGTSTTFSGEIIYIAESNGKTWMQIRSILPQSNVYIMTRFNGSIPAYKGDIVSVVGYVAGRETGTNYFGGTISNPLIYAWFVWLKDGQYSSDPSD